MNDEAEPLEPKLIVILIVGALIVFLVPSTSIAVNPFRWFTTFVHETGHAIAVVLSGGTVESLTINERGGGLTRARVPDVAGAQVLVGLAGYLSSTFLGCALLVVTRQLKSGRALLLGLAASVAFVTISWVPWSTNYLDAGDAGVVASGSGLGDGRFTWAFSVGAVIVLVLIAQVAPSVIRQVFVVALAALLVCSGARDLFTLLGVSLEAGGHSDAVLLADVTVFPAAMWAAAMTLVSAAALWFALRSLFTSA